MIPTVNAAAILATVRATVRAQHGHDAADALADARRTLGDTLAAEGYEPAALALADARSALAADLSRDEVTR